MSPLAMWLAMPLRGEWMEVDCFPSAPMLLFLGGAHGSAMLSCYFTIRDKGLGGWKWDGGEEAGLGLGEGPCCLGLGPGMKIVWDRASAINTQWEREVGFV